MRKIHVVVSYQVAEQFVEQNRANIKLFLDDFEKLDQTKFDYTIFLKDDGVTFVHLSNYEDEVIQQEVLSVPSFLNFQAKRDQSGLGNSHTVSLLEFIGGTAHKLPVSAG